MGTMHEVDSVTAKDMVVELMGDGWDNFNIAVTP
jgi:hypothetical protein